MRSAEANGLDCRKYLEYLFTELPNPPVPGDAEALPGLFTMVAQG